MHRPLPSPPIIHSPTQTHALQTPNPNRQVSWLYGVALGCTFLGLLVYSAPPAVNQALVVGRDGSGEEGEEEGELWEMDGGGGEGEGEGSIVFHPEVCWSRDGGSSGLYGGDEEELAQQGGRGGGRAGWEGGWDDGVAVRRASA
jgi:hypothetical protein